MNSIQLATFSNHAIYACLAIFAVAFVAHTIEVAWSVRNVPGQTKTEFEFTRTDRAGRIGTAMMILGFLVLLIAVTARGMSAHRVPWGNMYEFSITGALTLTGAYLFALAKYKLRWLGLPVSLATLLTLGTAITVLYRPSEQLVPALKSPWLALHVSAAIISGGVFLVANLVAATYLWMDAIEKKGPRPTWAAKIPSLESLDQLSYRLIAFVFHAYQYFPFCEYYPAVPGNAHRVHPVFPKRAHNGGVHPASYGHDEILDRPLVRVAGLEALAREYVFRLPAGCALKRRHLRPAAVHQHHFFP